MHRVGFNNWALNTVNYTQGCMYIVQCALCMYVNMWNGYSKYICPFPYILVNTQILTGHSTLSIRHKCVVHIWSRGHSAHPLQVPNYDPKACSALSKIILKQDHLKSVKSANKLKVLGLCNTRSCRPFFTFAAFNFGTSAAQLWKSKSIPWKV